MEDRLGRRDGNALNPSIYKGKCILKYIEILSVNNLLLVQMYGNIHTTKAKQGKTERMKKNDKHERTDLWSRD